MSGRAAWLGFALAVMLVALSAVPATAANWLELNFWMSGPRYDGDKVPACNHPAALDRISSRFSEKEGRFWNSNLSIVGFSDVRETSFRSWAPHTIPRRFCSAMAYVSDGLRHPVHYSIAEDTGMIGMTWGVEWCVEGLDRNWAYNPACKMARP